MKKIILCVVLISLLTSVAVFAKNASSTAAAQTSTPAPARLVTIPMADGLEVDGDLYPGPEGEKAPAALLLHQYRGSSYDWREFALPLQEKGYTVLAIDIRGQGLTGGAINWGLAESDAVALMGWLRDQPNVDPDRVAIVGASIGANLALRVCSGDAACHAVIALSPGINYFGVRSSEAIEAMEDKAVFLVASQGDTQSAMPTKLLTSNAPRSVDITMHLYGSARQHGTDLFFFSDLIPQMIVWLDIYN